MIFINNYFFYYECCQSGRKKGERGWVGCNSKLGKISIFPWHLSFRKKVGIFWWEKKRNTKYLFLRHIGLLTGLPAIRSTTHGAWFIRLLVATFYRHANHYDIEGLFEIVSSLLLKDCNYSQLQYILEVNLTKNIS